MNNESNDEGLGWIAAAITGAVSITTALIQNLNAKKAAKKAAAEAAAEAAKSNKVNAFAALDNQYYAESNATSNATNTRALVFCAVGIVGAYLLLKD